MALNESLNDGLGILDPFAITQNMSKRDVLEIYVLELLDDWRYQSRVRPPWNHLLIALYAAMIIFGSLGNFMVIYIVARNSSMRTARNVYVVNLAISDLMLCLITMPLTLVEILYLTWQFGNIEVACRLVGLLQATSVFVSTITITAIALDRRRLIVGSEQESPQDMGKIIATVPLIWGTALVMASPLAIWKTLEKWTGWTGDFFRDDKSNCPVYNASNSTTTSDENLNDTCILKEIILSHLTELQTCKEVFPTAGRLAFSIFVLLFQFLLPLVTMLSAYYQICRTLRARLEQRMRQQQVGISCNASTRGSQRRNSVLIRNDQRRERNIIRLRRTIKLLCWIGAIFCICWLPLNILNAVMDASTAGDAMSDEVFCGIYAVCHVLGMLSACANPVIYGFLNENFSKEFKQIGLWWKTKIQFCTNSIMLYYKQPREKNCVENDGND
ncbi:neuropeptide F receptor [Lepeophtheirus salmonis]|uniref:G-protein coupled receptors family 1 profile domain-containing protein n=1 Tax=Lepeophtheirus salmonis TaxID=72036 RepID=A0A0K2TN98_LEPSM|nr:neuropeptide F receptor-like [Lepeophtheirus salmonis]